MKKIAILAFLLCLSLGMMAQDKKEIRQQKRIERAERYKADTARFEDPIYKTRRPKVVDEKKGATSLIVTTSFENPKEVLDILVRAMIQRGETPKDIDKDYFIIKTEQKNVYNAVYDIKYVIFQQSGKVKVRASATAYKSFSVSSGMLRSNTDMIVPVEYKGVEGSLNITAWKEIEEYMLALPLIEAKEYIKPE